jgi:protein SCO1/2
MKGLVISKAKIIKQLVIGTLVLVTIATLVYHLSVNAKDQLTASVLPKPKEVASFKLEDKEGNVFSNQNLRGHWSLLFFGFTSCPAICPPSMTALKQAYSIIESKHKALPQVVFISVDPERDTPVRIKNYVTSFNKSFQGFTGNKEQLDKLTSSLGILYMKVNPQGSPNSSDANLAAASSDSSVSSKDYTIDHSGSILLVDPQGRLTAIFTMPHIAKTMASDYMQIVDHAS